MDTMHLTFLLDRLREGQIQQGALLDDLARDQQEVLRLLRGLIKRLRDTPSSKPSRPATVLPMLVSGTFAQYAASALLLLYVVRGGDILTAVAAVSKAFGGP